MYRKVGKRICDIMITSIAIILIFPIGLIIALLIKIESKGNILYIQHRVGKNNKDFKILKFRTMTTNADKQGLLTIGEKDNRVTKIGYYLRKFKLDELPQLINILMGEMSIVGPRPEVRYYVNYYNETQMKVLSVLPGLTDLASIAYIDENRILAQSENPQETYIKKIMPHKLSLNAKYIENISLKNDLSIIWQTLRKIINNSDEQNTK